MAAGGSIDDVTLPPDSSAYRHPYSESLSLTHYDYRSELRREKDTTVFYRRQARERPGDDTPGLFQLREFVAGVN